MKKSLMQVIIVRGKFYISETDDHLHLVEFDGTPLVLSPEPHIIINETSDVDLTEFLKNTIDTGNYVTVRFTEVDDIEGLFDYTKLSQEEAPKNISGIVTIINDTILIGDKNLYDFFWDKFKGVRKKYVYMEINVHK